ncbi:hypothetical protein YC2023_085605 [Brassica napus]
MNSNRNSTVSDGFISKQSNGTDRASSAEPIKCTGQSGVSSASPLRNINSPFGFHGAVNLSFDSNKRFVYDVIAYNSDDGKADQNGMGDFLNEMATMMNLCIVRRRSIPILIINVLARVSICLLCNLKKPTAVVLLKRVATEVKTLMGAVLIKRLVIPIPQLAR